MTHLLRLEKRENNRHPSFRDEETGSERLSDFLDLLHTSSKAGVIRTQDSGSKPHPHPDPKKGGNSHDFSNVNTFIPRTVDMKSCEVKTLPT